MINIFEWNKVKTIKLILDNGSIFTYENLKDTIIKFNQSDLYSYGFLTSRSLEIHLKSQLQFLSLNSCAIEIKYEQIAFDNKNRPYEINLEINKIKPSVNNCISFSTEEIIIDYKYDLIANKEGQFFNINLKYCGVQYIKEDENKKIIVSEPSVVYIIKDKKTSKKFRGYSNCLIGDIFNENMGINIARLKAEIKKKEYQLKELSK